MYLWLVNQLILNPVCVLTMHWITDFEAANNAENSKSGQRADPEQNPTEGVDETNCPSIQPPVTTHSDLTNTSSSVVQGSAA